MQKPGPYGHAYQVENGLSSMELRLVQSTYKATGLYHLKSTAVTILISSCCVSILTLHPNEHSIETGLHPAEATSIQLAS